MEDGKENISFSDETVKKELSVPKTEVLLIESPVGYSPES